MSRQVNERYALLDSKGHFDTPEVRLKHPCRKHLETGSTNAILEVHEGSSASPMPGCKLLKCEGLKHSAAQQWNDHPPDTEGIKLKLLSPACSSQNCSQSRRKKNAHGTPAQFDDDLPFGNFEAVAHCKPNGGRNHGGGSSCRRQQKAQLCILRIAVSPKV